jgi:hypothetical protein
MLRCASSAVQHPLSRLCSDDIAGDQRYHLILTLLDYYNSVLFGLPNVLVFSTAAPAEYCCSIGLQSSSDCPRHRRPDLPPLAAGASKSRCWYIARCKGHRRSTVGPSIRRRRSRHAPTCARSHVSNWSLLVTVTPAWATAIFWVRVPLSGTNCPTDIKSALNSSLSIFCFRLKTFLFCHSVPGAVV